MEQNPNPRIIEDLRAAGEELEKASFLKPGQKEEKLPMVDKKTPENKQKIDLPQKIGEYQKKISQELLILEKTHQEVKELEKKLERRIELLKGLRAKGTEISQGLKEFEEQLASVKREDKSFLNQINLVRGQRVREEE